MAKLSKSWVEAALGESDINRSKLDDFHKVIFQSSPRLKAFINNICAADNVNYLELGVYRGATLLAATVGNPGTKAVGVENYSYDLKESDPKNPPEGGFTTMKVELAAHIDRHNKYTYAIDPTATTLVEGNFEDVDYSKFDKFNICFMDIHPFNANTYDSFFEKVLPYLKHESIIIFGGVAERDKMETINKALLRHEDKFTQEYEILRVTSNMQDHNNYYDGIRIIGIKKKIIPAVKKAIAPKKATTPKKEA